MFEEWISAITLFIITLGFARMLGELVYHLRNQPGLPLAFVSFIIINLILFPPLSLPVTLRWFYWVVAFSVVAIFAVRSQGIPEVLLSQRFILRYISFVMLTSAAWYLSAAQTALMSALAAVAILAALLSWRESLQW